jgi:hypothetical protein
MVLRANFSGAIKPRLDSGGKPVSWSGFGRQPHPYRGLAPPDMTIAQQQDDKTAPILLIRAPAIRAA